MAFWGDGGKPPKAVPGHRQQGDRINNRSVLIARVVIRVYGLGRFSAAAARLVVKARRG